MAAITSFLPATITIIDLPLGSTLVGTELIECIQTSGATANSVQVAVSGIAALAPGQGGILAGSGISVGTTATTATITWAPGTSVVAGNAITVSTTATTATVAWAPGTTIVAGKGISVGTTGTSATITFAPGTSIVAGSGISVATTATTATITWAPGTSVVAGSGISVSTTATSATITWAPGTSVVAGAGITVSTTATTVTVASQFVLLNTLSPSGVGSTYDGTSLTATYRNYMVTLENVAPAGSAVLQMQVATSGTAFISGGYVAQAGAQVNGTLAIDNSTTVFLLSGLRGTTLVGSSTLYGVTGQVMIANPANAVFHKQITGKVSYLTNAASGTAGAAFADVSGYFDGNVNAWTAINFSFSAGNIATGTIKIYGMT